MAAWLRLTETKGVGAETARRLLAAFGLPTQIFAQSHTALSQVVSDRIARALLAAPSDFFEAQLQRTLEWLDAPNNYLLTLADSAYPRRLLELSDPPTLLYVKGRLELLERPSLGMVGARTPTAQGIQDARRFAQALAEAGLTITSGLALGIDAAAHEGALDSPAAQQAGTIAVIGTGADIVYPARNRALAHRIAEHGVILSEFPLGLPAIQHNFPRRNRIIAGLSVGVLVVEAAAQSGSLITARLAGEAGREVFAIPGSIHSPVSKGCHLLIKQGAKLVESAQDILEDLHLTTPTPSRHAPLPPHTSAHVTHAKPAPSHETNADEAQSPHILLQALGHAPCALEVLCARTGLTVAEVRAQLLELELLGQVAVLPGELYQALQTTS